MILEDPTTNGVWVTDETGAIANYDGAPFLGGVNHSQFNPDPANIKCVGIARHHDAHGEGYCLVLDFGLGPKNTGDRYRRYRMPRDGSAVVK